MRRALYKGLYIRPSLRDPIYTPSKGHPERAQDAKKTF